MNVWIGVLNCCFRMERDMVKDKREAWERDVEKMRQILAAQGCPPYFCILHLHRNPESQFYLTPHISFQILSKF